MSISCGQQLIKMTRLGPHLVMESAAMASQQFECPCCSELLCGKSSWNSVRNWKPKNSLVVTFAVLVEGIKIVGLVVVSQKAFYLLLCGLTVHISDQPACLKIYNNGCSIVTLFLLYIQSPPSDPNDCEHLYVHFHNRMHKQ